jgi:GNAT superfamily N-acetyltransferase
VPAEPEATSVRSALDCERRFVLALGGFALQIAGATLVTHERIPVPRFNFVEVGSIAKERQAEFFERALDHYFQRALRPRFRVPAPAPAHLDAGLRRFGFRPRDEPLTVLVDGGTRSSVRTEGVRARAAQTSELDLLGSFWTGERERPEFRAALETAWTRPHPDEQVVPIIAEHRGEAISAGIAYRHGAHAGIYAIATRPDARGQGAASAIVEWAIDAGPFELGTRYSMWADSPRLGRRLEALGFRRARAYTEYELPADAELALPSPGPPGPPQWRPPRKNPGVARRPD